jgi:hypothetical protein
MGVLLGYQCPIDLSKLYGKIKYSIEYVINKRDHLGCWYEINDNKNILAAIERLNIIR